MSRTSIILILGLVLLASALGLNVWFNSDVPDLNGENASSTEESVSSSNQDASSQQNVPSPGTIPAPVTMPDGSVQSDTETSQSEDAQSKAPDFDVVRISKDGDTVIAGRAPSGSTVTVMDGDETLGEVVADESGEWVFLPDQPLAPGNRELSLSAKTTGGQEIESENLVVLAVPERDAETGKLVDENPLAVLVPRDGGVTRVLQKPVEDEGVAALAGGLILDSIDYDDKGNVTISGRGANSATVRGYLDNGLLGNAKVENDGRWALSPTQVIEP
ncbi:MAG: hypothetical protein R3261_14080, partial [Alphaproteobacteria bacterium]|nr:hypothetical protein [Alphaproteobacteria bacterium]